MESREKKGRMKEEEEVPFLKAGKEGRFSPQGVLFACGRHYGVLLKTLSCRKSRLLFPSVSDGGSISTKEKNF